MRYHCWRDVPCCLSFPTVGAASYCDCKFCSCPGPREGLEFPRTTSPPPHSFVFTLAFLGPALHPPAPRLLACFSFGALPTIQLLLLCSEPDWRKHSVLKWLQWPPSFPPGLGVSALPWEEIRQYGAVRWVVVVRPASGLRVPS